MFFFLWRLTKPLYYPEMVTTGSLKCWYLYTKLLNTTYQKTIIFNILICTASLSLYSYKSNFVVLLKCSFLQLGSYFLVLWLSDWVVYFYVLNGPVLHFPVVWHLLYTFSIYVYCLTVFSTLTQYSIWHRLLMHDIQIITCQFLIY
jgi:hypothetical protein